MKDVRELALPDDLRYAEDHEWVRIEGEGVRIGISDYAQDQLGDVVYVDLPQVGASFGKGEPFGSVESVKAVSELLMPLAGEVTAVNEALADAPEKVNEAPYDDGWMIVIRPADRGELDALMDQPAYQAFLEGMK